MSDVLVAALGTGCLGALLTFIGNRLARQDNVKDKKDMAEKEIKELKEQQEKNSSDIKNLTAAVNLLMKTDKGILKDKLAYLARKYIRAGKISDGDLETMADLYECYRELGGNGRISALMDKVKDLPISD